MYPNHEPPTERLTKPGRAAYLAPNETGNWGISADPMAIPVSPVFHTAPKFVEQPQPVMAPQFHGTVPEGQGLKLTVPASGLTSGERALSVVYHIVGLVTYVVVLYSLWRANIFLDGVADAFRELANNFQDLGN